MTNSQRAQPPIFIDENVNVYEGANAVARPKVKSDSAINPGRGITQVDFARWQEAQRYECKSWMELYMEARTDRNEYHQERFAGYSPIRGCHFSRGIELGCGPFTNMRLILEHCTVD